MTLKDKILEVIRGPRLTAVATVSEESGKAMPAVRYMMTTALDDLTLVGTTMKGSRKVQQMQRNPNVALALWMGEDFLNPYVVIKARAEIHEDPATKKAFWTSGLESFFKGPEDPQYVVLKFKPDRIEYYSKEGMEVWTAPGRSGLN